MLQLGTFQNLQTLVEVSSLMSGQQELAWEQQDGVRCLQAALNGQPPISLGHWDPGAAIPKLEELDSLELGGPVSHPAPRPTILPHRLVVAHPYTPSVLDAQYVNLDGEVMGGSSRRPRVKAKEKAADTGEARPCRVCGERAGKHSYYGGQVGTRGAEWLPGTVYHCHSVNGPRGVARPVMIFDKNWREML